MLVGSLLIRHAMTANGRIGDSSGTGVRAKQPSQPHSDLFNTPNVFRIATSVKPRGPSVLSARIRFRCIARVALSLFRCRVACVVALTEFCRDVSRAGSRAKSGVNQNHAEAATLATCRQNHCRFNRSLPAGPRHRDWRVAHESASRSREWSARQHAIIYLDGERDRKRLKLTRNGWTLWHSRIFAEDGALRVVRMTMRVVAGERVRK
jgi:hypothetical protein